MTEVFLSSGSKISFCCYIEIVVFLSYKRVSVVHQPIIRFLMSDLNQEGAD